MVKLKRRDIFRTKNCYVHIQNQLGMITKMQFISFTAFQKSLLSRFETPN